LNESLPCTPAVKQNTAGDVRPRWGLLLFLKNKTEGEDLSRRSRAKADALRVPALNHSRRQPGEKII